MPRSDTSPSNEQAGGLALRTVAGLILTLVIVVLVYLGDWFLLAAVDVVVGFGAYEMLNLQRQGGERVSVLLGVMISIGVSWAVFFGGVAGLAAILLTAVPLLLAYQLFSGAILAGAAPVSFGLLYVGLLGSSPLLINAIPRGELGTSARAVILSVFASIWVLDTAAYLVGCRFGRHKLWPRISPGKTVEGSIAGATGAVLAVFVSFGLGKLSFAQAMGIGVIIAVFGQIGDLVESSIKRESGVKDSSGLIPGHGGFLDRFDSALLSFPLIYVYLRVLHRI